MKRRLASLSVAVALAAASPAGAHLESPTLSSRIVSLGGAFVSVADDPTAVVVNAAALTQTRRYSILSTYHRPYGLSDVNEGFVAASAQVPHGAVGVSWFYRGLRDALSENLFTVAVAHDLARNAQDASLSVGASLDVARVASSGAYDASATAATLGLSVLLRPFAPIGIAYSVRNVNEATLHLVDGAVGTRLERAHTFGFSYHWDNRIVATFERGQVTGGEWRTRAGVELSVADHLALRSGLDGTAAAVGVGVAWSGLSIDLGTSGHEVLGRSYVVTVGYGRGVRRGGYAP